MIPYVAAAETTGVGLVAAVLLLSGFGKIRHPIAAALAIVRFGLLPSVHVWAGRLAGVLEIAVAMGLVVWPTVAFPLVGATALLALFLVLIVTALMRGENFHCACFGTHGERISLATLARTGALFFVALGCLVGAISGGPLGEEDRIFGLCAGALIISLLALSFEVWRTAPFAPRFTSNE
ncbi:MAG: MauE/DoxX family redox-associated membrane protein [Terriglobia bacterium]